MNSVYARPVFLATLLTAVAFHVVKSEWPEDQTVGTCSEDDKKCQSSPPSSPTNAFIQTHSTALREFLATDRVDMQIGIERDRARARLAIEGDLRERKVKVRAFNPDENCTMNAKKTFEEYMATDTDLASELNQTELELFENRTVGELEAACKHDSSISEYEWSKDFLAALQHEKPVMVEELVDRVNAAGLGFTVHLEEWMTHESHAAYQALLGKEMSEDHNHSAYMQTQAYYEKHGEAILQQNSPPSQFDPFLKWPHCANVIGKIHNQGTCGSCWAFGSMSAVDSRVCITTSGAFQQQLSRTVVVSCARTQGCKGGLASDTYNYLSVANSNQGSTPGVPTGSYSVTEGCLPYFAGGEGTDHFDKQDTAPTCQSVQQCQASYQARTFAEDAFVMPGIANFREIWPRNAAADIDAKNSLMTYGPLSYGINANNLLMAYSSGIFNSGCGGQPNHEVTCIGWGNDGQDYWRSLNSWGPTWGENGGFRVRTCVVTDWTIPGDITNDASGFPTPWNGAGPQPTPATPAATPAPPAAVPAFTFTVSGACTKDSLGCVMSPNFPAEYGIDQKCVIKGYPKLRVESFHTEDTHDKFKVNGRTYSGQPDRNSLDVLEPSTNIVWTSDFSETHMGWRICPWQAL